MKNKYSRPYCKNCNLIWGKQNIGYILNCTKCGRPLVLKSFNPWPSVIAGLIIICVGGLTLLISEIPIIWIGGFLFGGSLFLNGFGQWSKIQNLDQGTKKKKEEVLQKNDLNKVIITCGKCSQKISVPKGKGVIKIKCPKCSGQYRITT